MFAVHGYWRILVKDNYVLPWFSACWNEKTATANLPGDIAIIPPPALTKGFTLSALFNSIAVTELNAKPVALTPIYQQ